MKLKHILCVLTAVMALSLTVICSSAGAEESKTAETSKAATETITVQYKTQEDLVKALGLKNPCEVDENGNITLEKDTLIDLILPEKLGGKEMTAISSKSFAGCSYIRSVVIPETILEIGEDAFANCKALKTIYVIGHSEDELTLGSNWNGGAKVVYVVDEIKAEKEPAQNSTATTDEQAPKSTNKEEAQPQPSDADNVKDTKNSIPATPAAPAQEEVTAGAEEKTTAAENGSVKENRDSASSNNAGAEEPQDNESVSAEDNSSTDSSAESSEEA